MAFGIKVIPLVDKDTDLVGVMLNSVQQGGVNLESNDIVVVAHTVVSKWEGRVVSRSEVEVSEGAITIAERSGFDPVHVELALRESVSVLREDGVLITETKSGLVCNFSGVDASNAPPDSFVLLPEDSDASAERILVEVSRRTGLNLAVIISDTQGRPWRRGSVNVALGCAGINAFKHNKGRRDLYGRELDQSMVCQIDEIASLAEPLMGQADGRVPVVIVRGYRYETGTESGGSVPRSREEDLFR